MTHSFIMVALFFALSACREVSIQKQYNANRDHCQLEAEGQVSSNFAPGEAGRQQKARLVQAFNHCMEQAGWDVGPAVQAEDEAERKRKRIMLQPPSRGLFPYEGY